MDRSQEYAASSLELHLFFARIMKEHALFLKAGFLPSGADMAREAECFLRRFEGILSRALSLSGRVVRRCVLDSGEVFTEFTGRAERQTQRLTGIAIDRRLTARAMGLRGRDCGDGPCASPALRRQVGQLNRDALRLVEGLIAFKERLLRRVDSCAVFTANYPLLIEHILREARLYRAQLLRLEGREDGNAPAFSDSELFWDRIMMEHALFIRGLLDPGEEKLIGAADGFAGDYRRLLEAAGEAGGRAACGGGGEALALTEKFRDFKQAGVSGIEDCRIRSLILPLLADHVLREANRYIRLLKG